ncbi:hypothetical protein KOI35_14735 [Actinoplanes bogorensis]|uniref:Uncharacterized protein n=1 Tax=Paractinoplanes bogorensis TaxID=1610840 RepID=A0ABS5YMT2_9ACTN|nr:hypothetical protein [Actinoplanes bogorensis]MBU2664757.1 hypothetical protein [Actinoplanes bogorensis]
MGDPDEQVIGGQRCRMPRRAASSRRSPLTVRHAGGRLVVRSRPRSRPGPPGRGGPVVAALAVALVVALAALLGTHPGAWTSPQGPCPARTSDVATTAGHTLRLRAEPGGGATLIHLCAALATGPIRTWAVATAAGPVPVQRLSDNLALASAALTPGEHTPITVDARLASGEVLRFATQLTVPALSV